MIKIQKSALTLSTAIVMLFGMGSASATLVNFEIEGTVIVGDEIFVPNLFNLTAGETITASGVFDDSVLGAGPNTATFGSGNTLSIDVNGTIFTHADDAFASLSFDNGVLTDFDFFTASFSSYFTQFDDLGLMFGEWNTVATITPVPVPAAVWLFGSGLIGIAGFARQRKAA
jgi:hypothetical protein